MSSVSANRSQLIRLVVAARFEPGCEPRPGTSAVINGRTYSVQFHVVNRKCYDNLSTPTPVFKIDGKRVSRAVWYASADWTA